MGYIHKVVNNLERTHAVVQQWAQQRGGLSLREKLFDGLPMQWQLADLCTAVRKQYKDIKFLCDSDARDYSGSDSTIVSVWAYFPGDAYALVRMTYARGRGSSGPVYNICARGIRNGRYGVHNSDYHTLETNDLAKATKHVKTYLCPYSVEEMAVINYSVFRSKATSQRENITSAARSAKAQIYEHAAFDREIANLVSSDYRFLNSEIKERIVAYLTAMKEHEERAKGRISVAFVNVRMQGDQQMFDVVRGTRCVSESWSFYPADREVMVTYDSETIPENIMSKLAVLSMLDHNVYLEDTGMKDSDATFWVCI